MEKDVEKHLKKDFDIETEFPNLFKQALDSIAKNLPDEQKALGIARLKRLMEHNLNSIVQRLSMPYVDEQTGELSNINFFQALMKHIHSKVPEDLKDKIDLDVYISGGVVRTMLAHIYKQLYVPVQKRPAEKDSAQERYLRSKLQYELERYFELQAADEPNLEELKDLEFLDAIQRDYPHIATAKDVATAKQEWVEQQLASAQAAEHENHNELVEAMHQAEAKLLTEHLAKAEQRLISTFVLGVGSDLDILYDIELKKYLPITAEESKELKERLEQLKYDIERSATDFINSAERKLGLRDMTGKVKHSLMPIGDVKDRKKQMSRTLAQGGSLVDTMGFLLVGPEEERDKYRLIEENPGDHEREFDSVFYNLVHGRYQYLRELDGEKLENKQIIRGLRSLLELPFIELDEESKVIIESQLIRLKGWLENEEDVHGLDKIAEQIEKMVRNAHFAGAHNRVLREEGLFALFAEVIQLLGSKNKVAYNQFPEFVQQKSQVTNLDERLKKFVIPKDKFIEKHTDGTGTIYHGTSMAAFLPILRNGFLVSGFGQGRASYGSGLYASPQKSVADSYAKGTGDGITISMQLADDNLTVIDYTKLYHIDNKELVDELEKECKEEGYRDINELLSRKYGVDIICSSRAGGDYLMVQNLDAFIKPDNIGVIVNAIGSNLQSNIDKDNWLNATALGTFAGLRLLALQNGISVDDISISAERIYGDFQYSDMTDAIANLVLAQSDFDITFRNGTRAPLYAKYAHCSGLAQRAVDEELATPAQIYNQYRNENFSSDDQNFAFFDSRVVQFVLSQESFSPFEEVDNFGLYDKQGKEQFIYRHYHIDFLRKAIDDNNFNFSKYIRSHVNKLSIKHLELLFNHPNFDMAKEDPNPELYKRIEELFINGSYRTQPVRHTAKTFEYCCKFADFDAVKVMYYNDHLQTEECFQAMSTSAAFKQYPAPTKLNKGIVVLSDSEDDEDYGNDKDKEYIYGLPSELYALMHLESAWNMYEKAIDPAHLIYYNEHFQKQPLLGKAMSHHNFDPLEDIKLPYHVRKHKLCEIFYDIPEIIEASVKNRRFNATEYVAQAFNDKGGGEKRWKGLPQDSELMQQVVNHKSFNPNLKVSMLRAGAEVDAPLWTAISYVPGIIDIAMSGKEFNASAAFYFCEAARRPPLVDRILQHETFNPWYNPDTNKDRANCLFAQFHDNEHLLHHVSTIEGFNYGGAYFWARKYDPTTRSLESAEQPTTAQRALMQHPNFNPTAPAGQGREKSPLYVVFSSHEELFAKAAARDDFDPNKLFCARPDQYKDNKVVTDHPRFEPMSWTRQKVEYMPAFPGVTGSCRRVDRDAGYLILHDLAVVYDKVKDHENFDPNNYFIRGYVALEEDNTKGTAPDDFEQRYLDCIQHQKFDPLAVVRGALNKENQSMLTSYHYLPLCMHIKNRDLLDLMFDGRDVDWQALKELVDNKIYSYVMKFNPVFKEFLEEKLQMAAQLGKDAAGGPVLAQYKGAKGKEQVIPKQKGAQP